MKEDEYRIKEIYIWVCKSNLCNHHIFGHFKDFLLFCFSAHCFFFISGMNNLSFHNLHRDPYSGDTLFSQQVSALSEKSSEFCNEEFSFSGWRCPRGCPPGILV